MTMKFTDHQEIDEIAAPATPAAGKVKLYHKTGTKKLFIKDDAGTETDISGAGAVGAFVDGGNSFGAAATVGTNDAFDLDIETNGSPRVRVESTGEVRMGASLVPSVTPAQFNHRDDKNAPVVHQIENLTDGTASQIQFEMNGPSSRFSTFRAFAPGRTGLPAPLAADQLEIGSTGHVNGILIRASAGPIDFSVVPSAAAGMTFDTSERLNLKKGIGVHGVTAPAQPAKINDPSGGATVDAEARTAINAIIDAIEAYGFTASV